MTSPEQKTLEYVFDIISDGVWDWDALSGHVGRSPGWYRMLGFEESSLKENVLTWEQVIHPDDYPAVMRHFEDYISGRIPAYRIQYRCIKANGDPLWIEDSGRVVERTPEGKVARMIGAHTNIHAAKLAQAQLEQQNRLSKGDREALDAIIQERTEALSALNHKLEAHMAQMAYLAEYDELTGVLNRRMFEKMLTLEIKRARRYSHPLSTAMVDIDWFKQINDLYGHSAGDQVLRAVAETLRGSIREEDVPARWGGEEFVIILPNTAISSAFELAERVRCHIAGRNMLADIKLTCSFGITDYQPGDTVGSMFARMDKALYKAKNKQRNSVQIA